MIEVTGAEDVFVLRMVADEKRFNPTMLDAFDEELGEVEEHETDVRRRGEGTRPRPVSAARRRVPARPACSALWGLSPARAS